MILIRSSVLMAVSDLNFENCFPIQLCRGTNATTSPAIKKQIFYNVMNQFLIFHKNETLSAKNIYRVLYLQQNMQVLWYSMKCTRQSIIAKVRPKNNERKKLNNQIYSHHWIVNSPFDQLYFLLELFDSILMLFYR